jgi:glutamyl-tRNA synthetase
MRIARLAPSPTGAQHLGNARTYLIAWLAARQAGAKIVLRIEDIDSPRIKPGAATLIEDDLTWLGLDWDEGPVVQSTRLSRYSQALQQLIDRDLVYPCTCSRTDIAEAASAPHASQEGPVYPGTCAHRRAADAAALGHRPFAWRFRVGQTPSFVDGFLGEVRLDLRQLGGDFVVWKNSGTPAYQLAVVVDDAEMGITDVLRGDDLVPSTPRQLLLYDALGWSPPAFTHVPLVVGPDGRRLAKRHGDTRIVTLREQGVTPEALLGLLAWSCGWIAEPDPITLVELRQSFKLDAIPKTAWILTPDHLKRVGFRPPV